jgi:hypothetical protein
MVIPLPRRVVPFRGSCSFLKNTSKRHRDVRGRTALHIKADRAHARTDRSTVGGDIQI